MNTSRFAFIALASALCGLSVAAHAQTPASNLPGAYQPLSPTAAKITLPNGKTVRGNIVGQSVINLGTYYVVETRKGRTVVNECALYGIASVPVCRDHHSDPLPNIHLMH